MAFVRTQVYLTPEHHAFLKEEAKRQEIALTELLRRILDEHMQHERPREDFLKIVALGSSGQRDVSTEHDRYIADALQAEHVR